MGLRKIPNYLRFISSLKGYFRTPHTLAQAQDTIRRRAASREGNFLEMVEQAVYGNPRHPFCRMLKDRGITFSRVREQAAALGLEGALSWLKGEGIYMTLDEFKGNVPLARNGREYKFKDEDLDNPRLAAAMHTSSGGSRSAGTRTLFDLEYLTAWSAYDAVLFEIYGVRGAPLAMWLPAMPAYAGIKGLLCYAKAGKSVDKWFFMNEKAVTRDSNFGYYWFTRFVVSVKAGAGAGRTALEYAPLSRIGEVGGWIVESLSRHRACAVHTYVSHAVRLCLWAKEQGRSLRGTVFILGSEPLTAEKKKIIEDAGCVAAPRYIVTEAGPIAYSCPEGRDADSMHILEDSLAVVRDGSALLVTSLLPSASKALVNVETGDTGTIGGSCRCMWRSLGLVSVISGVRSDKKIKTCGVTFDAHEIVERLERLFVRELRASPQDFQLCEEEAAGESRLMLFVSPEVAADDARIRALVLDDISRAGSTYRLLAGIWKDASALHIVRRKPSPTERGKLLHFSKRRAN